MVMPPRAASWYDIAETTVKNEKKTETIDDTLSSIECLRKLQYTNYGK